MLPEKRDIITVKGIIRNAILSDDGKSVVFGIEFTDMDNFAFYNLESFTENSMIQSWFN